MLQLLHLDVSKVDQLLHMGCVWEAAGGASGVRGGAGDIRGDTSDFWGRYGPTAGTLTRKPNTLGACLLVERVPSDAIAPDRTAGR